MLSTVFLSTHLEILLLRTVVAILTVERLRFLDRSNLSRSVLICLLCRHLLPIVINVSSGKSGAVAVGEIM